MALVLLAILLPAFLRASAYPHRPHRYPDHGHGHWHWHPGSDDDETSTSVSVTVTGGVPAPTSVEVPPVELPGPTSVDPELPGTTTVEFPDTETDVPTPTAAPVPEPTETETETETDDDAETETETEVETSTGAPAPTEAPEESSTEAPEEPSTEAPAPAPAPTTAPTPGAKVSFPANAKFDYQIGGPYTPASDVKVVTRDHSASPAAGLYNICYINAFQTQPDAASWWKSGGRDGLLLRNKNGGYFEDPDWEGEMFLDTSTAAKRTSLAAIINGWIDECAQKGFNAIEPDNLDTFTRSNGLLTADNNLQLAKLFTDHAHSLGLAVAQKNTGGELGSRGKSVAGFDFAVAEECEQWEECDTYTDVYGANMVEIEYTDGGKSAFSAACSARGSSISVILRDRNVVPKGSGSYSYQEC